MSYPSDLRDKDWDLIKPHFGTRKYGNRAIHSRRSLVDGTLYGVKRGISSVCCRWIFPYGRRFMAIFGASPGLEFRKKCWLIWLKIKRLKEGCNAHPSLLIIDAQSVKNIWQGRTTRL